MLISTVSSLMLALGMSAAPPPAPAQAPEALTMDQAVQQVRKKTDGRVLSADRVRSGHANKYRIKTLMDNGRVRVIEVDSNPRNEMRNLPENKPAKEKR